MGVPAPSSDLTVRRRITRLGKIMLTTVVAFFLAVLVLAYWFQGRLIYFPSRAYTDTPRDARLEFEDLTLTTQDGVALAAWYVPRTEPKGTVLFCHGNAGNISDRVGGVRWLHDLGYAVLIFDYRGYGRSAGTPSEQGMYRDAEAAWRWLAETRGEPPERIILFGESIGAAVAIELATRHEPGALVAEGGFTSLVDIGRILYPWLPVRLLCRFRYDSLSRVGDLGCPKLFIHARSDQIVPFENGRRLYEAAAEPKWFLETPGGHNTGGFRYSWAYAQQMAEQLEALRAAEVRAP